MEKLNAGVEALASGSSSESEVLVSEGKS
jgi:hypothetical protein